MNPSMQAEGTVEVRLRYRPVGDILTVSVQSGAPPGPRSQTELDENTLVEWMRMPDGSEQITAMQLLDARSRSTHRTTIDQLPEALREPALDLIHPGHRHHDHPSAHRLTNPTATHESLVRTTTDALALPLPRSAQGPERPG